MGDGGGGHWLVWMEWRPAGWSVCLPLLIFPCTIKSKSSLLSPAQPGGPGKRAVKQLWWWWQSSLAMRLVVSYDPYRGGCVAATGSPLVIGVEDTKDSKPKDGRRW